MYAKDVGTPLEVFRGRAHKTVDGRIQADFELSDSGKAVLRGRAPKKPLPEKFALYSEAKKKVLEEAGVKPGDPFKNFIVTKGSPEHEKILKLMKKSPAKK